jgi:hypothetical protein
MLKISAIITDKPQKSLKLSYRGGEEDRFIFPLEIETKQALVAANRELIARFERKILAILARVWGRMLLVPIYSTGASKTEIDDSARG